MYKKIKKYLKNCLFILQTAESSTKIIYFYMYIMLLLYPLFCTDSIVFQVFEGKIFLYCVITILTFLIYVFLLKKNYMKDRMRLRPLDAYLILLAVFLMLKIVDCIIVQDMASGNEIFFCCLIVTYFLLKNIKCNYLYFTRIILLSAVILSPSIIRYCITGNITIFGAELLFVYSEGIASWLILVSCLCILLYSVDQANRYRKFYLVMNVLSYLLLYLCGDMLAICMVGIFILVVPVMFPPTVTLIKKNVILCFLFLFTLSNIPLLQYLEIANIHVQYNIEHSIYIDLLLVLTGLFIMQYKNKIPNNISPDSIILKKVRRWYKNIIISIGIIFMTSILYRKQINNLVDKFGIKELKNFSNSLWQSINKNDGFILAILEDYGIIGVVIWIGVVLMITNRLIKQWRIAGIATKILLLTGSIFIIQSFFYKFQSISTPVFVIPLSFALCADSSSKQGEEKEGIETNA